MKKMTTTQKALTAAAAVAITALTLPGLASAQDCYQQRENRTNGAVLGGIAGAAIGGASSGHRSKGTGTLAGAVVGAMLGSAIADDGGCRADDRGYVQNDGYDRGYDRGYDGGYYNDAPPPPPPPVVYRETVYDAPPPVVYREHVYAEPRVVIVSPSPRYYAGGWRHHYVRYGYRGW